MEAVLRVSALGLPVSRNDSKPLLMIGKARDMLVMEVTPSSRPSSDVPLAFPLRVSIA